MRALVQREVTTPEPDEAACRRFYHMNLQRFRLGDLYEAAHILIAAAPGDASARKAARTTAETILAAVEADGRCLRHLAANHSDCTTSAPDGGRLGQIARGQTVPEFEAALERMTRRARRQSWNALTGFHVVRLDHRVEGKTLPFEMARERIADYLASSVEHRALAQYVSILAGRAEITGVSLSGATTPLVIGRPPCNSARSSAV